MRENDVVDPAIRLLRLLSLLPPRLGERVRALQEATVRAPSRPDLPAVDPAVLTELATACRRSEIVRFSYTDYHERVSECCVEPYQIVNSGGRWYLVARDRDRAAWRTFRLDRIARPAPAGLSGDVEVLDPPEVRSELRRRALRIADRHSGID